ncbi:MAG: hypothetical protein FJX02_05870 [Alphaproteobacteria bacterium]|nr:hypothetical protein [Alphaproteobacteria bacterium]
MRIYNPGFALAAAGGEKIDLKPVDWKSDAIALFSNSKPNARELLDGLKAKLSGLRTVTNIDYVAKNSASQPAPSDLIEKVAANYRGALLAIAD